MIERLDHRSEGYNHFMNHKAQVQLETHTVEDTQQFGQILGKWVQQNGDPLCIALIGD